MSASRKRRSSDMDSLPEGPPQPHPHNRTLSFAPYHSDRLDADRAAASAELDATLQGRPYTLGQQLDRVPVDVRDQIFRFTLESEVYKVGPVRCRKFGTTRTLMKVNCSFRYEVGKMFQHKILYHYHHDLAVRSEASVPRIVAEYHHIPQARQDAIKGVVITVPCSHKATVQGVAGFAQVMAMVPFFRQVWHIQFERALRQLKPTVRGRSPKMTWCNIIPTGDDDQYRYSSFQDFLQGLITMPTDRTREISRSHSQLEMAECIKRQAFRLIFDERPSAFARFASFSQQVEMPFVEAVVAEWKLRLSGDEDLENRKKDLFCEWLVEQQTRDGVRAEGFAPDRAVMQTCANQADRFSDQQL